ncbi:MAG: 4-hydroxybenzoate octaprenyltransferase [Rhodobacteraceae bacterium]|nr:4-hydroxybenzoate octaprenyltransferase [Paracoccaceae bacterium]
MADQNQRPDQNDAGRVTDAYDLNWVDRYCPVWSRPYLRLSRADRPIGTWLLLIPCWWGLLLAILADAAGPDWYDLWIAAACTVGAFLMRGAGCTWNDITDRHIDAQVERTRSRPLPSGQVTPKGAAVWMAAQMVVAFAILMTFNSFAVWLGIAALIPVAIYPFAKRFTWWPQVFLGIAFNWGVLVGWAAHTGSLSLPPVLLYLAAINWTLFYDTIYAHQDKEDDALIGVKSTARLFAENTARWLLGFQILALLLMLAAIAAPGGGFTQTLSPVVLTVVLGGVWVFGWHLAWQLRHLNIDDAAGCLHLFRSNRDAGLILVAAWGFALML